MWARICSRGAAAAAVAALSAVAAVVAAEPPVPKLVPLAEGVWLQPGTFERGRQPDGNSLLLRGPDGLVLVDSGRHAGHAQALLDAQRTLGAPLRVVINTHWHLDHLGGNALLRREVPSLQAWASPALRAAIDQRMPRSEADLRRAVADPALDADTRRMMEIDLGLYAVRDALRPDRVLDGADEALPFERALPGHGPLLSRAEFVRYKVGFEKLLDCAASTRSAAECSAGWIDDLGPLLPAGSERIVRGMRGHYLEQKLRAPPAERERDCAG
jgi:hypothetical protein